MKNSCFVIPVQVHIVSEGDSFSVSCIAGGNPPPLIKWSHGSNIVSESVTLTLQQVSVHDTGEQHQSKNDVKSNALAPSVLVMLYKLLPINAEEISIKCLKK